MKKEVYIHKKTRKEYLLISTKHRFKLNGVWHDGYLYQPRYENEYEYFSKTPEEFNEEFSKASWINSEWVPEEPEKMKDWTKVKSPFANTEKYKKCSTYIVPGYMIRNSVICPGDLVRPSLLMGEYSYCDFESESFYAVTADTENVVIDVFYHNFYRKI